jgi:hypothetical protein
MEQQNSDKTMKTIKKTYTGESRDKKEWFSPMLSELSIEETRQLPPPEPQPS